MLKRPSTTWLGYFGDSAKQPRDRLSKADGARGHRITATLSLATRATADQGKARRVRPNVSYYEGVMASRQQPARAATRPPCPHNVSPTARREQWRTAGYGDYKSVLRQTMQTHNQLGRSISALDLMVLVFLALEGTNLSNNMANKIEQAASRPGVWRGETKIGIYLGRRFLRWKSSGGKMCESCLLFHDYVRALAGVTGVILGGGQIKAGSNPTIFGSHSLLDLSAQSLAMRG